MLGREDVTESDEAEAEEDVVGVPVEPTFAEAI